MEIEVEIPRQTQTWKTFFRRCPSFFISALKRRSIEVSERHLSQEEHEQFKGREAS